MQPICQQPESMLTDKTKLITVENSSCTKTTLGKFCGFIVEPVWQGSALMCGNKYTDDSLIRCCSFYSPIFMEVAMGTPIIMANCNPVAISGCTFICSYTVGSCGYYIIDNVRKRNIEN